MQVDIILFYSRIATLKERSNLQKSQQSWRRDYLYLVIFKGISMSFRTDRAAVAFNFYVDL